MQNYTYSPREKVLVWRKKIENNRTEKFIGPFTVYHHDERSKIIAIFQDGAIKRYSASRIRPLFEQPSMLDDSITERKMVDRHEKMARSLMNQTNQNTMEITYK